MFTRRAFLLASSSTALWSSGLVATAIAQDDEDSELFLCSTLAPTSAELDVTDYVNDPEYVIEPLLAKELEFTDYGVAASIKRWKKTDGLTPGTGVITLGVYFLDGDSDQQATVRERAARWLDTRLAKRFAFDFDAEKDKSQIRITFSVEKNESYVGRDALTVASSKPTMFLWNLSSTEHEFGHALCLLHEHRHTDFPYTFKEDVVLADLHAKGWTKAQVYSNILTKYQPGQNTTCVGDNAVNLDSIMIYNMPSTWTKEGVKIKKSGEITQRDRNCLYAIYGV